VSGSTAAVLAAALAAGAAVVSLVVVVVLSRRTAQLRRLVEEFHEEALPLVRQARRAVDQAATEMERVGDVLGSAEAVTATVDSASRLAYRALANPVVGALAFTSGVGGALRRFFGRAPGPTRPASAPGPLSAAGHRRRRAVAGRTPT
jgi:hypothetical protein